jgi:hypothetical protein
MDPHLSKKPDPDLEPSRVCGSVVAVSHHFDEKPYPDPNPHKVNKSNPDLNQGEKPDPNTQRSKKPDPNLYQEDPDPQHWWLPYCFKFEGLGLLDQKCHEETAWRAVQIRHKQQQNWHWNYSKKR